MDKGRILRLYFRSDRVNKIKNANINLYGQTVNKQMKNNWAKHNCIFIIEDEKYEVISYERTLEVISDSEELKVN
ncbi:hypothetical protein Glove_399g37 [Diversispora epigaea]|uniref:Uncharacterized protein n=1 Tax=Diversispora epigaea TaxID=1348612 RepID=A0A397H4S2_9GLOM|nr:hypothetical protein Glove_399g37 [Diversispora epigaea]